MLDFLYLLLYQLFTKRLQFLLRRPFPHDEETAILKVAHDFPFLNYHAIDGNGTSFASEMLGKFTQ